VRYHDLPQMPAALEMPVGFLSLGEGECPVDHGTQAMQRDGPVHRLKIRAAPDADRPDRNAAAGQQLGVQHRPRWRQARADQADMPADGQGLQRFRDRSRSANLDDAIDAAAIGQFARLLIPIRRLGVVDYLGGPSTLSRSAFSAVEVVAITLAPKSWANCSAKTETPPEPCVKTESPAVTRRCPVSATQAVTAAHGRVAASSIQIPLLGGGAGYEERTADPWRRSGR
jgi:hypothetical protein